MKWLLILALSFGAYQWFTKYSDEHANDALKTRITELGVRLPRIVMYSATTCPSCRKLKKQFESLGIAYEEILLDKGTPEEMRQRHTTVESLMGQQGIKSAITPVVLLNGTILPLSELPAFINKPEVIVATLERTPARSDGW